MTIQSVFSISVSHVIVYFKSLRDHAIKIGNDALHWLGLSVDYEEFDAMIPLGMYLLLTANHKLLLRNIAVLDESRRKEFANMLMLDDISLMLICLPAIIIKFYPVVSERLKVVVSSIIYAALALSIFIQRRINTKLILVV